METLDIVRVCPRIVYMWILVLSWTIADTIADETRSKVMGGEYCQFDTFEPSCGPGEVVQIEAATYGRMRLGKCVQSDLGFVGCSANVLDIVDRRCSGKVKCSIKMPDELIASRKPCMTELTMYLEVNYTCRKVIGIEHASCRSCDYVKVTQASGLIASAITRESGCGAAKCPWLLEAGPGQRLEINLLDYGWKMGSPPILTDNSCQVYATIKEVATSKTHTVCATNKRTSLIYTSESHALELRIVTGKPGGPEKNDFIFKYSFIGCETPTQPRGGWARRDFDNDVINMGCNETSDTWKLRCEHDEWVGERRQCPGYEGEVSGSVQIGRVNLPSGLSIVIIIAVAFVVGAFILCIGIIMFRKRYLARTLPPQSTYPPSKVMTSPEVIKDPLYMPPLYHHQSRDTQSAYQERPYNTDRENYTHIWERPLPNPTTDNYACSCPTGTGSSPGQRVQESEYNTLGAVTIDPRPTPASSNRRGFVYGNNTMARKECEMPSPDSDNDPRYFQVDPETM